MQDAANKERQKIKRKSQHEIKVTFGNALAQRCSDNLIKPNLITARNDTKSKRVDRFAAAVLFGIKTIEEFEIKRTARDLFFVV